MKQNALSMRIILMVVFLHLIFGTFNAIEAQIVAPKFGNGIRITAQDSSFYMKVGLRFQTLFVSSWNLPEDNISNSTDHSSTFSTRRSRLKFDGWAINPRLKYKCELALSNRDNGGGGDNPFFNRGANIILDASMSYNFYKGFTIWAGQGKMPGNRERIISSGSLQFVDRSRLNSRFTLDRDVGIMLLHKHKISKNFVLRETFAFSSGEGKNITTGNIGGYDYTFKLEAFPFGDFQSKGAYIGSSIKREATPKLALAIAYNINQDAGRTRGQLGSFLVDDGVAYGKDITSLFIDLMFKYQGWSVMAEYANRNTEDNIATVFNASDEAIGTYYTGEALNFAVGYMTKSNYEVALRWTTVNPDEEVGADEEQYTLGVSKFIVGHKLKVQSDLTYRAIDAIDDELMARLQLELHF